MRRLLDGVMCDTDASKLLGSFSDGARFTDVYKTVCGKFFSQVRIFETEYSYHGSSVRKRWVLRLLSCSEASTLVMRYFPAYVYEENFEVFAPVK